MSSQSPIPKPTRVWAGLRRSVLSEGLPGVPCPIPPAAAPMASQNVLAEDKSLPLSPSLFSCHEVLWSRQIWGLLGYSPLCPAPYTSEPHKAEAVLPKAGVCLGTLLQKHVHTLCLPRNTQDPFYSGIHLRKASKSST